jgi:hypothetical protein
MEAAYARRGSRFRVVLFQGSLCSQGSAVCDHDASQPAELNLLNSTCSAQPAQLNPLSSTRSAQPAENHQLMNRRKRNIFTEFALVF